MDCPGPAPVGIFKTFDWNIYHTNWLTTFSTQIPPSKVDICSDSAGSSATHFFIGDDETHLGRTELRQFWTLDLGSTDAKRLEFMQVFFPKWCFWITSESWQNRHCFVKEEWMIRTAETPIDSAICYWVTLTLHGMPWNWSKHQWFGFISAVYLTS